MNIRLAKVEDAEDILSIYEPYIKETNITFEYTVPSIAEFKQRMAVIMSKYPYIVAEKDGKILGYAYAHEHMERAAYQWNVETSIYISMENRSQGLGTLLYSKLLQILRLQHIQNVYACVTLPNINSERIHKAFGFELVGHFHKSGYKFGVWHDVGWFELSLDNHPEQEDINPIITIGELNNQVREILSV